MNRANYKFLIIPTIPRSRKVLSGDKSETRGSRRNSHIFARRVIVIEKISFMTMCFVSLHGPGDSCFSTFYNDPFLAVDLEQHFSRVLRTFDVSTKTRTNVKATRVIRTRHPFCCRCAIVHGTVAGNFFSSEHHASRCNRDRNSRSLRDYRYEIPRIEFWNRFTLYLAH